MRRLRSYVPFVRQSSVWSRQLRDFQSIAIITIGALSLVVVLLSLTLVRVLLSSLKSHSKTSRSQTAFLLNLLTTEQQRTARLTNLVASKDAMTYATLEAQTLTTSSTSEYITPVGTDEDELARYQAIYGNESVTDSDVTDEFREYLGTT